MAHEELKQKIEELEKELKETKVNKRTEASVGLLKGKIARLKEELEEKSKKKGKGEGFAVKKEGDATIGLLGKPSVGKSTLLSKITNKESRIGAYEFTTLEVVPGLLNYKFTNLQILDLPGIIKDASLNKGFGRKVLSVVRACDLIVFIVDAKNSISEMKMLLGELKNSKIKVNENKPFIEINRTFKGGIEIPLNLSSDTIPNETIINIMHENKFVNAEVLIHEKGIELDQFIDSIYDSIIYTKGVICLNKIDLLAISELKEKIKEMKKFYPKFNIFGISADKGINLDGFCDFIWKELGFIWVYLKEQRQEADMKKPLVLKKGDTIQDLCEKIHKDFLKKFKYAKIKGKSAKFDWQRVGLEHFVKDKDIIEIYAR